MDYPTERTELLSRPGRPGPATRAALAGLTDDWLATLFGNAGARELPCALVAVGGYGRGDLSPASDLDLLLLHAPGTEVQGVAEKIWYPIWDARVSLDHSVRTPAQARALASQDLKVLLGLLDARTIVGDPELASGLRGAVLGDWRAMATRRLDELHAVVRERAQRSGQLAYLLEPDLKESYGGLRDVTVLRALEASWVVDTMRRSLAAPIETLLDARDALHRVTGRAGDKLTLQEQGPVATVLGEEDPDALLRSISAAGREIGYACDVAWHRADRLTAKRSVNPFKRLRSSKTAERAPLIEGVVVQDGEAVLARDARPDSDPVLVLRAAAAAAQAGLPLNPDTVERLARESAPMPVPWPTAARDSFISLIGSGRSTIPVWEALDRTDLITRLIPEWAVVRSAPQRNPVHRFTVDRHLVETAVTASSMTRHVNRPDLLLVGALLHDIGKARGGDHTAIGVDIVEQLAPRLGFQPSDTETLMTLVRLHLLLPDTATRRDLADPATAQLVADAVGNTEILELLYALTQADAAATGPAAWSPWKARLVDELVARTRGVLVGSPPPKPPVLSEQQRELATRDGVQVLVAQVVGAWDVTVAADDRVGLLSTVAGVLALRRLAVRSARTETLGNRAVTVWTVQPEFGEPPGVPELREDIRLALSLTLNVEAKLATRAAAYAAPVENLPPPRVDVLQAASERATVIEVRAHDAHALLFKIAAAISSTGVSIDAAKLSTLGSDVVDVFYLTQNGQKLDPLKAEAIRVAVLNHLGG